MFFRNRTSSEKSNEDRELISENEKSINSLIVLANNNEEFISTLKSIQERIKYLIPSTDKDILDFDKKIRNIIGDLRILLTKNEGNIGKKEESLIRDLNLTIEDRSKFLDI